MGDIVRGALTSIEKHQWESSYALGLSNVQTFRYILIPQALRRITPGAINLATRMIKTSSLVVLIGVVEVIKIGQQIIESSILTNPSASFWIYGTILYYLLSTFSIIKIFRGKMDKLGGKEIWQMSF